MNFIIYNSAGEILRTGTCPDSMSSIQAQANEFVTEGVANDCTQYILNGIVTDFTLEELTAKSTMSYGYKWKMPERQVVQFLTDEEIYEYTAKTVREKRDYRLKTEIDIMNPIWWDTLSEGDKMEWSGKRQSLLDVTRQVGFPLSVIWPD